MTRDKIFAPVLWCHVEYKSIFYHFVDILEYLLRNIYFSFLTALNKVFKFADVEETGQVDVATIATLAVQLMGANFSEAEKESVNKKAEMRAEKGVFQILLLLFLVMFCCLTKINILLTYCTAIWNMMIF